MMKRLASLLFLIALTGCQPSDARSDPEIQALRARLAGAASPGPGAAAAGDSQLWEQTRDFYQRRQYQPVWIIDGKARDSVATLRTLLAAAGDDGLDPGRYPVDDLLGQVRALKKSRDITAAADVELALTGTLLRYSNDLALGRPAIARQIDADWTVSPRTLDVVGIVLAAVADNQLAALPARLAPPHAEYTRLKAMLQRYRKTAATNPSAQARVAQLALNLERWRWLPAGLGTPHIFVNIPSFSLQVRGANPTVPLKMRVIVGKGSNRTPIFSDSMTKLVFSPYWNIPQSIKVKEMLPLISKDPTYLNKKDIEVVRIVDGRAQVVDPASIDWANAKDAGDFQLRQRPGGDNALGFVKFLFPNRHQVYLHDTPSDNLFDKLTRDLSHGCVRVEQPVELAAYVLRDQPEWTGARIQAAMHAGKEEHVQLTTPVAVHLVYLTARVDEDGAPQFFDDVYGYDGKQQELSGASVRTGAANAEPAHDVATGR